MNARNAEFIPLPNPPENGKVGKWESENRLHARSHLLALATVPVPERVVVLQKLIAAARADNHCVLNPTHVMLRGSQIIGYLSINGLPMVHCWFDTFSGRALDTLKMIEHGETAGAEHGITDYTIACAAESPLTPHMERLGFVKLGTTVLWRKTRNAEFIPPLGS